MASIASSIVNPQVATVAVPATRDDDFETRLQIALEHARRLNDLYGSESPDVAVAWETVEELLSFRARQRGQKQVSAFERFCALNPDAGECRSYDV